jgi:hypothetical protein
VASRAHDDEIILALPRLLQDLDGRLSGADAEFDIHGTDSVTEYGAATR